MLELEFLVDVHARARVEECVREAAGEGLARLTIAPVDGTPRYRIIARISDVVGPAVMRAVMNTLDEKG